MDNTFVCKSMFTWYKEMLNLDQQVTDETIIIAAEVICEKMGQPVSEITQEWVSKFKDRYGIRTEDSSSRPQMSALWRAKRRRKISQPEPSQELMDKRARLGKSYAIDEDSDLEKEGVVGGNEEQQKEDKDGSDTDSLCGFSFEELNSVPEYKPHECPHCTERYLWGHQLREHMKCHSDVKTYLCTICGKSYKSPHNLKIHMRVHTGDRPYVCTTCDKGFREQSALVKHTRIHTGERPFLCSDCGSAFISKTQLNIHVKTHHSDGQTEKRKNSKSSSSHTTTTPVSTSLTEDDRSSYSGSKTEADSTNTSSQVFSASNMEQPSLGQLLPGTGFYVTSTTAGSISCGTPIVSANQYSNKVPNMGTNPQQRQQEIGQVDQTQVQMAQDFINSAAAQAYLYQDYYYNT